MRQWAANPAALTALGVVARLMLLCKEQDHWRQLSKSSAGAEEDPDLRASAIKAGFLIEGAVTWGDLVQPPGSEPLMLRPVGVFHPLCMCRYHTAKVSFPLSCSEKSLETGNKTKRKDRRTPPGGLTFDFPVAKRKMPFLFLCGSSHFGVFCLSYSSPLQRVENNLMAAQLSAEQGSERSLGRAVSRGQRSTSPLLQPPQHRAMHKEAAGTVLFEPARLFPGANFILPSWKKNVNKFCTASLQASLS